MYAKERDIRTKKGGLKFGVPKGPFYVIALAKSKNLKGPFHITSPLGVSHYLLIKGNTHKLQSNPRMTHHGSFYSSPLRICFLVNISKLMITWEAYILPLYHLNERMDSW